MKEKKWHDDIPEKGVLCKDSTGNLVKIVPCDKDGDDYYALNWDEDCISSSGYGYHHDELTPLTADEWWGFAPWQDMKDAQIGVKILIDLGIKCVIGLQYKKEIFITTDGMIIDKPIKWLPLPQVKK